MANTFYFGITHDEVDNIVDITSIEGDITNLGDDISGLEIDISYKADLTYVDTQLGLKSDTTQVTAQLATKSDSTWVISQLALKSDATHLHDDRYYTELEISNFLGLKSDTTQVVAQLALKPDTTQVTTQLGLKANTDHSHNDLYYTELELNTSGAGGQVHWDNVTNRPLVFPVADHSHNDLYYTENEIDIALLYKSDTDHSHNDVYYTETEINNLLLNKENKKYDITSFNSSSSITSGMLFSLIVVDATSDVTLNLPSTGSGDVGSWIGFAKINTGKLVLKCGGANRVADSSAGGTLTNSHPNENFATIKLIIAATNRWLIETGHGTWTTN